MCCPPRAARGGRQGAHSCDMESPGWLHNESKPDEPWKQLSDAQLVTPGTSVSPSNYTVPVAHMFQFAARYGGTAVPASQLTLAPGQPVKSGLGLLQWLEVQNEPDGTWNNGRNGFYTPFELVRDQERGAGPRGCSSPAPAPTRLRVLRSRPRPTPLAPFPAGRPDERRVRRPRRHHGPRHGRAHR